MTSEEIARVCHEANRAMTHIVADVPVQPPWDEIDADMRASCVKGVEFSLSAPNATARDQHEAWCQERINQGWRWGPLKDTALKLHPALRGYDGLPEGTRRKDAVFRAIVGALRD